MPELTKIQTGFIVSQGAFELDPGTAGAPGLFFTGNTSTGMFSPSSGVLGFSTGSTQNALTILANGNVGIGTTNPSETLHINGQVRVESIAPFIKFAETGLTGNPVFWTGVDGGYYSIRLNNTSPYPFNIRTTGTNNNKILDVLIGGETLSDAFAFKSSLNQPTYFDIKSQTSQNGRIRFFEDTTEYWNLGYNTTNNIFNLFNTVSQITAVEVDQNNTIKLSKDNGSGIAEAAVWFSGDTGAVIFDNLSQKRIYWNDGGGNFGLRAGNRYSGSEKYITTGDGAVEVELNTDGVNGSFVVRTAPIGTSGNTVSWSSILNVTNTNLTFGDLCVETIAESGFVGIGTGNPAYKLDVRGIIYSNNTIQAGADPSVSGQRGVKINDNGDSGTGFVVSGRATGQNRLWQGYGIAIGAGGTETSYINSNGSAYFEGNVGIGFTNPTVKLQVSGSLQVFGPSNSLTGHFIQGADAVANRTIIAQSTNGTNFGSYVDSNNQFHLVYGQNDVITGTSNNIDLCTNAGSPRVRINSSGNVGIGTTNPTEHLDVRGNIYASAYIKSDLAFQLYRSASNRTWQLGYDSNGDFLITIPGTSGAEFRIGNSGTLYTDSYTEVQRLRATRVGIGTDSPDSYLQIGGDTGAGINEGNYITFGKRVTTVESNLPYIGHLSYTTPGTTNDLGLGPKSSGGSLFLFAGNGAVFDTSNIRMTIRADGNVGIGITTPNLVSGAGTGGGSKVQISGSLYLYEGGNVTDAGGGVAFGIGTYPSYAPMAQIKGLLTNAPGTELQGDLGFYTRNYSVSSGQSLTEKVRIKNDGNFGIGTTNPTYKLEVNGSTYINGILYNKSGTTGGIINGEGSGSVALTTNDGYGNANICFNHRNGIPDNTAANQSSCRITCTVDTSNAAMSFQLKDSVTNGVAVSNEVVLVLQTSVVDCKKQVWVREYLRRNAPVIKTANFTVSDTENWIICNKSNGSITVTLPTPSDYTGREIMFKTVNNQSVLSSSYNVTPIDSAIDATDIICPSTAGSWATLVSTGSAWMIMQQG